MDPLSSPALKIILRFTLFTLVVVAAVVGFRSYQVYWQPNVRHFAEPVYLEIPTGTTFPELVDLLERKLLLLDSETFLRAADLLEFQKEPVRTGRFAVRGGMNNQDLIDHLRDGKQAPVDVTLTHGWLVEDVAAKAARFIEPDSAELMRAMRDTTLLHELGFDTTTLMAMFVPNTYELFWNTPPADFLRRMRKEYDRFWARDERSQKAETQNLSPVEVYTLASILERETRHHPEKPRMAGVYLNRLRTSGWKLQADPTSVFARRDFTTRRVTQYHLRFDSPYNTYVYSGLPPGPISMAGIPSIDAVLNPEAHDYFFFVSRGDDSGAHNFSETLAGHKQNIKIYKRNRRKRAAQR